jgi:hypothetical protein
MEGEICKNSIYGLWKLNSRIVKRHNKNLKILAQPKTLKNLLYPTFLIFHSRKEARDNRQD